MPGQHKRVQCTICKRWMRSDNLKRHSKTHTDLLTVPAEEVKEESRSNLAAQHKRIEIIHHDKYEVFTCMCGELMGARHQCENQQHSVKVVGCVGDCKLCSEMELEEIYDEQWEIADGYTICSYCRCKSDGSLPKSC